MLNPRREYLLEVTYFLAALKEEQLHFFIKTPSLGPAIPSRCTTFLLKNILKIKKQKKKERKKISQLQRLLKERLI